MAPLANTSTAPRGGVAGPRSGSCCRMHLQPTVALNVRSLLSSRLAAAPATAAMASHDDDAVSCMDQLVPASSSFSSFDEFDWEQEQHDEFSWGRPAQQHSKYDRILRFVEHNSPAPLFGDSTQVQDDGSVFGSDVDVAQQQWHNSYDEEAEEGDDAEDVMPLLVLDHSSAEGGACTGFGGGGRCSAADAEIASVFAAACQRAQAGPHASTGSTIPEQQHLAAASPHAVAERALGGASRSAVGKRRAAYLAATSRAQRRAMSPVYACYGDLEHMEAWVDPKVLAAMQAAAADARAGGGAALAAKQRYQKFVKYVERNAKLDPRLVQSWQFTFDEDVHGSFDEGMLSSC